MKPTTSSVLFLLVVELSLLLLKEGINQLDFFSNLSHFGWHFCSAQQSNAFRSDMSVIFK